MLSRDLDHKSIRKLLIMQFWEPPIASLTGLKLGSSAGFASEAKGGSQLQGRFKNQDLQIFVPAAFVRFRLWFSQQVVFSTNSFLSRLFGVHLPGEVESKASLKRHSNLQWGKKQL